MLGGALPFGLRTPKKRISFPSGGSLHLPGNKEEFLHGILSPLSGIGWVHPKEIL